MRDSETGLDAFAARYMSGAQGRFQSADPGNVGADPTNPQTWNAYNYVGNNPMSVTDPSGLGFGDFLGGLIHNVLNAFSFGIWDGIAAAINGASPGGGSFGSLPTVGGIMGCGGPLGNCGGIGGAPWNEQSPIGPNVQDPSRFVFDAQAAAAKQSAPIKYYIDVVCGTLTLNQDTGSACGVVGTYAYASGMPGDTDYRKHGSGPIPPGRYTIYLKEISPAGFFRKYIDPAIGETIG